MMITDQYRYDTAGWCDCPRHAHHRECHRDTIRRGAACTLGCDCMQIDAEPLVPASPE